MVLPTPATQTRCDLCLGPREPTTTGGTDDVLDVTLDGVRFRIGVQASRPGPSQGFRSDLAVCRRCIAKAFRLAADQVT